MAVPRTIRPITKEKAAALIEKHEKDGTGYWEGSPMYSDFVYGTIRRMMFIRPSRFGDWETGRVSM